MLPITTAMMTPKALSRFWKKVKKAPKDKCWTWTSSKDKRTGYGNIWFGGKTRKAHRVSYAISQNGLPEGLCVLHTCDNPECVNPHHLWTGTQLENIEDRVKKGRTSHTSTNRGEKNGQALLTEADVRSIRRQAASGKSQRVIGVAFGICQQAVSGIVHRKSWAHVS